MDIVALTHAVTTTLAPLLPYLVKAGEKAAEESGKRVAGEAWDRAKELWTRLRPKVEAERAALDAAEDVAQTPDDLDKQAALRVQIKKLLTKDQILAEDVNQWWERSAEVTLKASGERSVVIGGAANTDMTGKDNLVVVNSAVSGDVVHGDKITSISVTSKITATALHQLRAPVGDFVGREQEIEKLIEALTSGLRASISGVNGMGGIGKTELALLVAERILPEYPDGQLFINLQGTDPQPRTSEEVLRIFVQAFLGTEIKLPDDLDQLTQLYRSQLSAKKVLIVLDNAANSAQVLPFLTAAGCALLITSRQSVTLPGMIPLALPPLSAMEARKLLLEIAPRAEPVVDQLCELCGCLPLAIRAVGSVLATSADLDPADYAVQLKDEHSRLELIGAEGVEIGVEASFSLSYARLGPEPARVFRQLAVFPVTFDAAAVEAVCVDPGHAQLSELVRRNLVFFNVTTQRYRLHDLARLFAGARLTEDERAAAQRRHATYYEGALSQANNLYLEGGTALVRGLALFDLEWENIKQGHAWAVEYAVTEDEAARLCISYPKSGLFVLSLRQHSREQIHWFEASLAAARRLKEPMNEASALGNLGVAYADLGETRRAAEFYEQQLVIVREKGHRQGEAAALGNLGSSHAELGDYRRAIELHEQALAIDRETGDRRGEGNSLGNLGIAYKNLGETRKAIEFYEHQLVIVREIGDRRGESTALGNLGNAYGDLGDTKQAIKFYEQQLVLVREIGYRRGEGNALGSLGVAYAISGEMRRAIDFHEHYLTIAREIGDRRGEGTALGNLALSYAELGETRKAIEFYEQCLLIAKETGGRGLEGVTLGNLGSAYQELGDTRQAIEFYEQQLLIGREVGDRRGEGNALGHLGEAYAELGETKRAIEFFEQVLVITQEIGNRRGEGLTLGNLGRAYFDLGETRRAIQFLEHYFEIAREIGDRRGEANALWYKCLAFDQLGERTQANACAEVALSIYEQIEDPHAAEVRDKLATWRDESRGT